MVLGHAQSELASSQFREIDLAIERSRIDPLPEGASGSGDVVYVDIVCACERQLETCYLAPWTSVEFATLTLRLCGGEQDARSSVTGAYDLIIISKVVFRCLTFVSGSGLRGG